MENFRLYIGNGKHAEALKGRLGKLMKKGSSFLFVGEAGTGKTTIARELARNGAVIECSAPESEVLSQLDSISSGVVVLDELEQSSFSIQSAIVKAMTRTGSNVQFIVTLRENLSDLSGKRRLLDDIYSKLLEFENVELLPLRERPSDIPHFVRRFAPNMVIDVNALSMLTKHPWIGNIGELKMVVERTLARGENKGYFLPSDLVEEKTQVAQAVGELLANSGQCLERSLDTIEKAVMERVLGRFGFDTEKAAKFLGIPEQTLEDNMHRLALVKAEGEAQ